MHPRAIFNLNVFTNQFWQIITEGGKKRRISAQDVEKVLMNCLIRGSYYGMAIKPEDGAVMQHSIFSYDYQDSENVTRVEFKRVLFELITEDDLLEMD